MSSDMKSHYRSLPRVDFSLACISEPISITFQLFTRENPDEPIVITKETLNSYQLNAKTKTVFLLHGWTSSPTTPWYPLIKQAHLKHHDYNIVFIDWSEYAAEDYKRSAANIKPLGVFIAEFLTAAGLPPEKIHLVGHSLGAQFAGFIGKSYFQQTGRKIGRITGLDPAGPQFSNSLMTKEDRLSEEDAEFVDVVHTDIQIYGYTLPCGHVDFYPNGGTDQPGCTSLEAEDVNCNHRRAALFFAESIGTRTYASEMEIHEDNDYNVVITRKNCQNVVVFGEHVNPNARGVFYLETGPEEPFLQIPFNN
ncbi:hypothetical protein ABEB36_012103 [Hypothenemus hampei]|uniref:Lipase domain-containing protein n=1 Tax=Hypothenemus hampei TaxID=57062 RepID=A0ABD1EA22_HYPHA